MKILKALTVFLIGMFSHPVWQGIGVLVAIVAIVLSFVLQGPGSSTTPTSTPPSASIAITPANTPNLTSTATRIPPTLTPLPPSPIPPSATWTPTSMPPSPTPLPPAPTWTPTSTFTPQPPSPITVFADSFNSNFLDTTKWDADNTDNPFTVRNGTLQMGSSSSTYPYVRLKVNPFPSTGNFQLKYRLRYPQPNTCGVGVLMTSYIVPNGLSQNESGNLQKANEQNGVAAGIWQDNTTGMQIWFRSGADRKDITVSQPNTMWHEVKIEYIGDQYKIHLNSILIYTSLPTAYRPQSIWMGHPANLGSKCSWSSLEVDYVTVESLP